MSGSSSSLIPQQESSPEHLREDSINRARHSSALMTYDGLGGSSGEVDHASCQVDLSAAIEQASFVIPSSAHSDSFGMHLAEGTAGIPVLDLSSVNDSSGGQGTPPPKSTNLDTSECGVPNLDLSVVLGSPGHTPFPVRVGKTRVDHMDTSASAAAAAAASTSFSGGGIIPHAPCNTPDDASLMDALKREAKRQEKEIKDALLLHQDKFNLASVQQQLFKTPEQLPAAATDPSPSGAAAAKKRRNRKDMCAGMTAAELEQFSNDTKITEYRSPMSVNDKEVRRRNRISSCISMLRKIVPGVTEDTENTEVFEASAKYIAYLKQRVGKEFDKEFLSQLMPL